MSAQGPALELFLTAWEQLARARQGELGSLGLRQSVQDTGRGYLGERLQPGDGSWVPELVFEPEFARWLGRTPGDEIVARIFGGEDPPSVVGLFVGPDDISNTGGSLLLAPELSELMTQIAERSLIFRTGFVCSEAGVVESIALGFDGVFFHSRFCDKFELQYCVEICRDASRNLIVVVDDAAALELTLATDAPYVGFWCYHPVTFSARLNLAVELLPRIPATCRSLVMAPRLSETEARALALQGAAGFVVDASPF